MLNTSLSPWPSFTKEESDKVASVLLSNKVNYWTGQEGRDFEKEFALFSDCNHAVAVANGTLALDLALKSLDIGLGDEVIVTSRTFIASASCIINCGAKPVFADVELESQNISANSISKVLTQNTKAIICVHLAGWPCEMDEIVSLAKTNNLFVIEDCAQAHGAKYKGKSVGSFGDVAAWSFCQDKIITTGAEGGMLTTNSEDLWRKAWAYKDHGKSYAAVYEKKHESGFRWLHESIGTNWRLTEIQSAIGRIQLSRMPEWNYKRTTNSHKIFDVCRKFSFLKVPVVPKHIQHAYYKCYVFIDIDEIGEKYSRDSILEKINAAGVPCFSGSCSEVYKEKAFSSKVFQPKEKLINAKSLATTSLMFLVHPSLTEYEMSQVCLKLHQVFKEVELTLTN